MATTKAAFRSDWKKRNGDLSVYIKVTINSVQKLFPIVPINRSDVSVKLNPKYWDFEKGRVKKNRDIDYEKLNGDIETYEEKIKAIIRKARQTSTQITFDYITNQLSGASSPKKENKSFLDRFQDYIDALTDKAHQTVKHYRTTKNHLETFQKETNTVLNLYSFDLEIYNNFRKFLIAESGIGLANNSANKHLTNLKAFLNDMTDKQLWETHLQFDKYKKLKAEEPYHIFLAQDELQRIFEFDFINNLELLKANVNVLRLDKIRDMLVFACTTGLRESDFSNIKAENIKDNEIEVYTIKTKQRLKIPLNDFSRAILKKYDNILPTYSQQKFNDHVKEVCRICGITSSVIVEKYRNTERIEKVFEKWQLVSSHTGRRTFITQCLERGIAPEVVQKYTGHKDYRSFMKYVKIADKRLKEEMTKWNK